VRVRHLGRREDLPAELLGELDRAAALTAGNAGLRLQLAINYGGRQEIVEAATGLAREAASGALKPEQITEADFVRHLHYPEMPDPDVLIRTGGDLRVSNYLLWQIAYAEIYVTATLWPDFRKRHLYEALLDYQGRQRRFGGVEGEG
jgi:undecaprenyl diphosphate synthase